MPQDRLRKLNEENKQLAQNLKSEMDEQSSRAAAKSSSKKKKTAGSDFSSARGSEDRQSLPPTGRGQKRGRDNEIERVGENISSSSQAQTSMAPPGFLPMDDSTTLPGARRPTRQKRPTPKVASNKESAPPTKKARHSINDSSLSTGIPQFSQALSTESSNPQDVAPDMPSEVAGDVLNPTPPTSSEKSSSGSKSDLSTAILTKGTRKSRRHDTPQTSPPPTPTPTAKQAASESTRRRNSDDSPRPEVDEANSDASSGPRKRKATPKQTTNAPSKKLKFSSSRSGASQEALLETERATIPNQQVPSNAAAAGPSTARYDDTDAPSKKSIQPQSSESAAKKSSAEQTGTNTDASATLSHLRDSHANVASEHPNELRVPENQAGEAVQDSPRSIDESWLSEERAAVKGHMNATWFPENPSTSDGPPLSYNEHEITSQGFDWDATRVDALLENAVEIKERQNPPEQKTKKRRMRPEDCNEISPEERAADEGRDTRSRGEPAFKVRKTNPEEFERVRIYTDEALAGEMVPKKVIEYLREKKDAVLGPSHSAHKDREPEHPLKEHPKFDYTRNNDRGNTLKMFFYKDLEIVDRNERLVLAGFAPEAPPEDFHSRKKTMDHSFLPKQKKTKKANQKHKQEEQFNARPAVKIDVGDKIKSLLVDDWENVTRNLSLLPLPAEHPVSEILDTYFEEEKPKRRVGTASADLLEEVVSGLRLYFEECLGKLLLYRFEREQYFQVRQGMQKGEPAFKDKSIAEIYGVEHLCRLLGESQLLSAVDATPLIYVPYSIAPRAHRADQYGCAEHPQATLGDRAHGRLAQQTFGSLVHRRLRARHHRIHRSCSRIVGFPLKKQ